MYFKNPVVGIIFLSIGIMGLYAFSMKKAMKEAHLFQQKLNEEYRNPDESPLYPKDRASFKSHDFFPVSENFIVKARITKTNQQDTIVMPTVSGKSKKFIAYANLQFSLQDSNFHLQVYRIVDLLNDPQYNNHLFLPFRDLTNDVTTYAGGRYIDLTIADNDYIWINFNMAYNPYCAYSEEYNCPIVPNDNFLNTEVNAGVRLESGHFNYNK